VPGQGQQQRQQQGQQSEAHETVIRRQRHDDTSGVAVAEAARPCPSSGRGLGACRGRRVAAAVPHADWLPVQSIHRISPGRCLVSLSHHPPPHHHHHHPPPLHHARSPPLRPFNPRRLLVWRRCGLLSTRPSAPPTRLPPAAAPAAALALALQAVMRQDLACPVPYMRDDQ
jgi:hypothetical protein